MVAEASSAPQQTRAEAARATSFLDLAPPPVRGLHDRLFDSRGRPFGPDLCKLTPWRHHLLLGFNSPFVGGEVGAYFASPARVTQALYLAGPSFAAGDSGRFWRFRCRWAWLAHRRRLEAADAFSLWLSDAFRLMPPMPVEAKDGAGRPSPDTHWLAGWVRLGRRAFGMSEAEVLHTPYVRLWQYLELEGESDPERPRFNRKEDKKRGEYLRRVKEKGLRAS